MQAAPDRPQLTPLIANSVLDRLERLRINASRRFTSKSRGEHLAGRAGASIEFSDYRDYAEGDDIRFVDWNIFARLNRPYMKLYQQEEELHVVLIVDASASMQFERKLARAVQLAAAFGVMGLLGRERVSAYAFNSAGPAPGRLRPCTGRAGMASLFRFLEGIEPGGDAPVEAGIESALKLHTGRGVAVVLSDFMTFGDVTRALNAIFSAGLEVFGLQVLGPGEAEPELSGDLRLVDCETRQTLDITSAQELLYLYEEYRDACERQLSTLCRQRFGRFLSVRSDADVEWLLFDLLTRKGWLR
ncbi:MAG: DUF58 domain-containing protein [Candidatus Brocadiaceae bacterium]|nr:DUF58 domain-containing protein [Candidatus Brocadiaceae bacterium]